MGTIKKLLKMAFAHKNLKTQFETKTDKKGTFYLKMRKAHLDAKLAYISVWYVCVCVCR